MGTCVQIQVIPPECTVDGDCQTGFACNNTVCVQVPPEVVTHPEVEGVEGEGTTGFLGKIINAVQKSFVFIVLLLALLLLLLFFFWRKRKPRARTHEELIADEEERGRRRK